MRATSKAVAALALAVMIGQAACSDHATHSDGGSGSSGSSGGAAAGTGGDTGAGGAARGGTGGGGSGGAGPAVEFACGSAICTSDQSLCYAYLPGVPGGGQSRNCVALPAACAGNPTCACVCPPSSSPALGCSFAGNSMGGSCTCSDAAGVTVTCAGQ